MEICSRKRRLLPSEYFIPRHILNTETPRGGATSASLSSVYSLLPYFKILQQAVVEKLINSTATYQSCNIYDEMLHHIDYVDNGHTL